MALMDPSANATQTAPASAATRAALFVSLTASFLAVSQAGMVPPVVAAALVALVVTAQLLGHPRVLGHRVAKVPTTIIALALAVGAMYATTQFGLAAGVVAWSLALFALSVDWNTLVRLPLPLLLSLLLVTVALTRGRVDSVLPVTVVWTVAIIATLVLMERDASAAGPRLQVHEGAPPPRWGKPGAEVVAIALLVLLLAPVLALLVPNGAPGRPNRMGDAISGTRVKTRYQGFQDRLDSALRPELTDEIVMRVQADAPDYWRGTTYDTWDGRYWTKSTGPPAGHRGSGTVVVPPTLGDTRGGATFRQVFTVEQTGSDLFFGAYRPSEIEAAQSATVDRNDGTVRAFSDLPAGTVYTVISQRQTVTAQKLRDRDPLSAPIPKDIAARYLPLPDGVPERVKQLAKEITGPAPTTYDKVKAIDAWTKANTEYSLDIPPLPEGADAVEQYLFVDKKGFCEIIASSSAVMLRSQGIPARVATGYVSEERNPITGEFIVRARGAHAWVEVWFPGIGWQAFDPTADVPLSGEPSESSWNSFRQLLGALLPWLILAAVASAIGFAAVWIWRRVRHTRRYRNQPWAARLSQRLLRDGHSRDRPRQPHESVIEFAAALAAEPMPDERLIDVGRVVSRALFAGREPTTEQRAWVERVLDEAEAANPPRAVRKRRRQQAKELRRATRVAARTAAAKARSEREAPAARA